MISLYQILLFLIIFVGIFLAFWVYFSDRRSKICQFFFLLTITMVLYLIFGYFSYYSDNYQLVLLCKKLFLSTVSVFIIFSYFFSVYFPKEEKRYPTLDKFVVGVEIISIFVLLTTNLIVKTVEFHEWGVNIIWGAGKNIFFGMMVLLSSLLVAQIFKKYFRLSNQRERLQVQYFLIGILIFAVMNIIFNMIFPALKNTYEYHYWGDYSAIFLLGFTAFAIVKRQLFGISVVLTSIFVGLIAILLFLDALFFTQNTTFQLIKGVTLIIFLYFGYQLIRSVIREIKRREELQRLYEEVDRLSKAKSEFLSITSHQLRTPLTAIKGYISMILEGSYGKIGDAAKEKLERVYQSNEKLINFINDLLNISRIERGKIELQAEKGKIEDIITQEVEELTVKAKEKGLYLKWKKPKEKLPEITMDIGKIKQVVGNLIDNAIKYTDAGGITVDLKNLGSKVRVIVSDTGAGMDKDEINRLFESFTRGAAGTQMAHEGLGLGLYIARKFMELHDGRLFAESDGKEKGSRFIAELPIVSSLEFQKFIKKF